MARGHYDRLIRHFYIKGSGTLNRLLLNIFFLFLFVHAFAQEKHSEASLFKSTTPRQFVAEEYNPVDVIHYDVSLVLDFMTKEIRGVADIDIALTDTSAESFYLHLQNLDVSAATINGGDISFLRQADKIYFQGHKPDSTFRLSIQYSGTPANDGFGGFFFQNEYVYTIGEGLNSCPPSMLRYWMPSHDVPNDKATLDLHLTVPGDLQAFSNGLLISILDNGDGTKTFTWQENHPIATYLVAIAVGPYATFSIPYTSVAGRSLPLEFYVFPEHLETAREDWKNITQMMDFFERHYAPYPFDRYSMAEAANRGAMEHQTMTTYSSQLVTGDHRYDYIVAHELAHHWWGDLVTLGDWKDIWLNEGFATYSEALYFQSLNGDKFMQTYMDRLAEIYFREVSRRGHFAIYDPEYLWGGTIYQKGAWVLHMLRWTVGDDAFWRILKSYAERYAYDNAVTTDFIAVAEEESGRDLDWFFEQWIYQPGYPDIDVSWNRQRTMSGKFAVNIEIEQKQWDKFQFTVPLEILIITDEEPVLDTLVSAQQTSSFSVELDSRPISIEIDPNNWLLKQYDIIAGPHPPGVTPTDFYLAQNYPNPFAPGETSNILYYVARLNSPHPVSIKVYNILGREIRTLVDKSLQGGYYNTKWDGKDDAGRVVPAGVYIYRLQSDSKVIERKLVLIDK